MLFLDLSPIVIFRNKNKNNKWNLIKLKNCFTTKEIINKMKRQSTDLEKIFSKDATKKEFISKIYKQFNIKKKKNRKTQ